MRKNLFFFISVGVLLSIMITSCAKRKPEKIRLGYVSKGLSGLAVEVMKSQKIPEKYGITFKYIGFLSPSSMNEAFMMGKFDVNLAAGVNVITLARNKGYKVQYFFPTLLNSVSLIVKKDSPYASLKDLKGKKIGWYGLPSGGGIAFYVLCRKRGINALKDFQIIQSKPPALIPLLEKGEVEAIVIYEPFVSRLLATGKYRILMGPFYKEWEKEIGIPMEMAGLAASEDWLQKHRELAMKVINIWKETSKYIKNNIEKVLKEFPQYTGLKTQDELKLGISNIPPIYVDSWDNLDKSIQKVLKILAEDKVIIKEAPENAIKKVEK